MKINVLSVSRAFPSIKRGEQTVTLPPGHLSLRFECGRIFYFSGNRKNPDSLEINSEYSLHYGDPTRKIRIRILSKD